MLFGLPFSKMPEDERDRVDMAVERMTVPDVEFLWLVAEKRKIAGETPSEGIAYVFGASGVRAAVQGTNLRLFTPDEWNGEFSDDLFRDPRFLADRAALSSLVSIGCFDTRFQRCGC